jgi:hypothetical protein
LPPIMTGLMHAASSTGARLVYAHNLYAYGPVDGPLTEALPAAATGPNGRLRAELANTLLAAHRSGTLHATIGRSSDFYGRACVFRRSANVSSARSPGASRRRC